MDLDMAHSIEVLTVSTSSSPGQSMKSVVPLQVELTKYPIINRDEGSKLRRPVRPIDRQRMRPWLMELLDLGNVFGLLWTNRPQGVFQISWRHASRLGWNLETDGDVFERWAKHTGIYKEGDHPEPKRWKANFRCALHSLHDVAELTNAVERRGRNACRTYRFLQSSDEQSVKKKKAKSRRTKEIQEHSQQKSLKEIVPVILESGSSEDVASDTESEASHQDKVIVQTIDMKPNISGEDFCLHHDHDYAGLDKTQKTIVLRQGVGSIMLHKEVENAPDASDEVESLLMSNLDQLASAAMNSACIDSVQTQEIECYNTDGKTCRNSESHLEMPQPIQLNDSDVRVPKVSLRHLLMERNVHGVHPVNSEKSRKRKSLALTGDSFMVKFAETEEAETVLSGNKKMAVCVCSQEKMKCQSSIDQSLEHLQSNPIRQRSGSPKILCRRSKRNRAKNEKCMSEISEPLMSSCLLLLEAATRLDNAEKTGVPSISCKEKQNLKLFPESNLKTNTQAEMVLQSSDLKCENAAKSNSSQLATFEILRTTLENANIVKEYRDSLSISKPSFFKESNKTTSINAVSSSGSKTVATEKPLITGLFSGVKIRSGSQFSLDYNKLEEDGGSMRSKNKLFVCEEIVTNNQSATELKRDNKVDQFVSEELLSYTDMSAVKTLKGTITSHFDTLKPVLVSHTISTSGHGPQMYVSSESDLLESSTQIESSNQECIALTSEIQDNKEKFPLPTSVETSCIIIKEQPLLPVHKIEKLHVIGKNNIISAFGSQNVCTSSSLNVGNSTMKSLQTSVSSVTLSPAQEKVTLTNASCLPVIFMKVQPEIKKTTSTNVHIVAKSEAAPEPDVPVESNKEQLQFSQSSLPSIHQQQVHTVSTLPRLCQLTSKHNTASLESVKPAVPIIINGKVFSMDSVDSMSTIIKPETQNDISLSKESNVACNLIVKVAQSQNPVDMSSVISSVFSTQDIETITHSDIISGPCEVTVVNCPDTTIQDHSSILLTFQETLQAENKSQAEDRFTKKCDSLLHAGESVGVKSLAELCKRHLAHFFSTLDNHTSESEENDSLIESPELELVDDTCLTLQCKNIMQAVPFQQKHDCLKSEAVSQECNNVCQQ